jgi:hypothetical protein
VKVLKTHMFACSVVTGLSSKPTMVTDLEDLTCGQCKGQILEWLRAQDWNTLPDDVLNALDEVRERMAEKS